MAFNGQSSIEIVLLLNRNFSQMAVLNRIGGGCSIETVVILWNFPQELPLYGGIRKKKRKKTNGNEMREGRIEEARKR